MIPQKFQNKYRIPSARLQTWDYSWAAAYFITICTQGREHYFGEIENGKMVLSEIGVIVQNEWIKTPDIRPDMNLKFGEFMVMPNHFHGIIIIGENLFNTAHGERRDAMHRVYDDGDERRDAMHRVYDDGDERRDAMHRVSTADIHTPKNQFAPQSKNLASIIRGFKSAVTMQARQLNPDFAWQSRFHDHIIRDAASFERISNYIINNPLNWDKDKFHGTV